jgi:hypothetical protein
VSKWLLLPANRGRGEWDKLFETALDAGDVTEELLQAGADWIQANWDKPQVPILVRKLLASSDLEAAWNDGFAELLAEWLKAHAGQSRAFLLLRALLKIGVFTHFEQSVAITGVGWKKLIDTVHELTLDTRNYIAQHEVGDTVTGKIAVHARNGYLVHLDDDGRVIAFLPGSQLDLKQPSDWDAALGTTCEMELIGIDPETLSILVSRRTVLERERRAAGDDPIGLLSKGQIVEGTIANIVDYGLFVDVGGINGLLHRSKLTDPSQDDLANCYENGQLIQVEIIELDVDRSRVGLKQHLDPVG